MACLVISYGKLEYGRSGRIVIAGKETVDVVGHAAIHTILSNMARRYVKIYVEHWSTILTHNFLLFW